MCVCVCVVAGVVECGCCVGAMFVLAVCACLVLGRIRGCEDLNADCGPMKWLGGFDRNCEKLA